MSPHLLAVLREIDRETRQLANSPDGTGARWPRDYHRSSALLRRWGGAGRFFYVGD